MTWTRHCSKIGCSGLTTIRDRIEAGSHNPKVMPALRHMNIMRAAHVLPTGLGRAASCLMLSSTLAAILGSCTAMAATPPITPQEISALRQVTDAQIAPDGQRILYSYIAPSNHSAPTAPEIWVVTPGPRGEAKQLRGTLQGDHDPRWSPDGSTIALLRTHDTSATHGTSLVLLDVSNGKTRSVTGLTGTPVTLTWAPDGRSIAVITREALPALPHHVTEEGRDGSSHLVLLDVSSLKTRTVQTPDPFIFDINWAPKGQRLIVRSGKEGGLDYYWYRSTQYVIKTDGTVLYTLPDRATAVHASFSPDGNSIAYGYFSDDGIGGLVGIIDLSTGKRERVAAAWGGAILKAEWDADGHGLTVLGFKGVETHLAHVAFNHSSTDEPTEIATVMGEVFSFSRDRAGDTALAASTRITPSEIWLYHDGKGQQLTHSNPDVAQWSLGEQRVIHWKAKDGLDLSGMLVLPPNANPHQPMPLFVQVHGGPLEAWYDGWLGSWHNWARMLASHGIAVFMPNPRGSEGGSQAFSAANRDDWGGKDYQDILSGVEQLEKDGIADPAHLALGGWSYGGFMGMWAAGHNDRFKTIIAGAGISDLMTMAMSTDVGLSFIPPYFGAPLTHRADYAAHSPLSFVQNVSVPVLLLHGDADTRVPTVQSRMFYAALHESGKTARFIHYPGAPHWFGGSVGLDAEIDVQQQVLSWLQKYL
ncbi:S9 family peptidase [Gluconobacter wancherniae]|uniref:S9 family peptidase n=1 Tax=Gluconobacter wancherniae TaxID=1307955 RepID=UPI001B8CAE7D|nr:S9 family peptidase [Gluconobacter wancherniae]MBS1095970.1 S9 family peptidase [Gluconobacter wancherniae]